MTKAIAGKAPKAPEGTLTVLDVATLAGVTSKDMRRWLRAQARNAGAGDALPGKGGRYGFTQAQAKALAVAYGASKAQRGTQAPGEAILSALAPKAVRRPRASRVKVTQAPVAPVVSEPTE